MLVGTNLPHAHRACAVCVCGDRWARCRIMPRSVKPVIPYSTAMLCASIVRRTRHRYHQAVIDGTIGRRTHVSSMTKDWRRIPALSTQVRPVPVANQGSRRSPMSRMSRYVPMLEPFRLWPVIRSSFNITRRSKCVI